MRDTPYAIGVAIFALLLWRIVAGCNGREASPDCGDAGEYCVSHDGREMCCVAAFPYCGRAGTDCPAGYCCNTRPR